MATLGPDGKTYRYFAPAGGPGCNFVFTGDCNTQTLHFYGRWFGEMDFRLAKAFQLPGKARFEFSAEIFNATKALNFPNTINPGASGGSANCVPHDHHTERRPDGAARVARELVAPDSTTHPRTGRPQSPGPGVFRQEQPGNLAATRCVAQLL